MELKEMEAKSENPPAYSEPSQPQQQHAPTPVIAAPSAPVYQVPGQMSVVQTVMVNPPVGPSPCRMVCPSCGSEIVTRMEYNPTSRTHTLAIALCLLGGWCCICVPYCMDCCHNAEHFCPSCNAFLGVYTA